MTAHVIVDMDVKNQTLYDQFKALAPAAVTAYGGNYPARAGRTQKLEGDCLPTRLVILEFENIERASEWSDSPEDQPVKKRRQRLCTATW